VREHALIHVGGPAGAGKTTFIEAVLGATEGFVLADDPGRKKAVARVRRALRARSRQ
jgi:ABC-type Mn2+/Zn2+ transport system ATPase subunit